MMKKRSFFLKKFIIVLMLMGLLSPSVTFKNKIASDTSVSNIKREFFAKLLTTDISISLFQEAEARSHRRSHSRHRRRGYRRRANYRHHRRRYRRHRGRHRGRAVGGFVAGMVIGAAINSASSNPRCEIVYVRGLRYQDCGGRLRRY